MNKTVTFLLLLILTACGTNQGAQPTETSDASRDVKGNRAVDVSFREGEITDIADYNPNFLDLNTENEAHNNQGAYQQKLREIVESSDVFDAGMIYINGYKAIVNVTPKRKLSYKEFHEQRGLLQNRLSEAVPRYQVVLNVNTDNQ
ncbi:hypothetical protein ACNQFZ_12370 [Schinkia sp. CFF1]